MSPKEWQAHKLNWIINNGFQMLIVCMLGIMSYFGKRALDEQAEQGKTQVIQGDHIEHFETWAEMVGHKIDQPFSRP